MTNNEIFKKLRVALMLRDDQIVDILQLVDFRITKSELSAFFRAENHENYMECGDQILRNFLNGLVIHLRGSKEEPKNPKDVLASHKAQKQKDSKDPKTKEKKFSDKKPFDAKKKSNFGKKGPKTKKIEIVEKVKFKNGKKKSDS